MPIKHIFRRPVLSGRFRSALETLAAKNIRDIKVLDTEYCYNIESSIALQDSELPVLIWLISETYEPENTSYESFFEQDGIVIEVGPRLRFESAWSTNAVSVCRSSGINSIIRIERTRRYLLAPGLTENETAAFTSLVHDRMVERRYLKRLETFESGQSPEQVKEVDVLNKGPEALKEINASLGLGFDKWDIGYYYDLFVNQFKRNPTDVECFDLGQSNSEHSRHWFFNGKIVIDGSVMPHTLFELVKAPYIEQPGNSIIAFKDNASAIRGFSPPPIRTISPLTPGMPSAFGEKELSEHITLTAETHNFPSGVAPFPGAETGTGGRIRDVQAVGRGGHVVAGTAAYCVGNLHIPQYSLPWEDTSFKYPPNLAPPLKIEIEASNGASDYGNKFGEPLIQGFTRSFGMRLPSGQRREWLKPIMFTGGVGRIDYAHTEKGAPERDMLVVKIGGPAYRIGMGGGAASSMIQGENEEALDFDAVQRGDAEMEQKLNRVLRACIELGPLNPIISIHDQGAGGNCNVLKEICEPEGARIEIRNIPLGDKSLSVLEIWGAEYQEQNAFLIKPESRPLIEELSAREKVPCAFVGVITGDGRILLHDEQDGSIPVNLELEKVLGKMPRKTFESQRPQSEKSPPELPPDLTVEEALQRVLKLVSVGSKRFLATKVDRSVTGLVAAQQCVGPLGLTVNDFAIVAMSHFATEGAAISIGEQPIAGLLDTAAMARLSVSEALTNIVWAGVSALSDIRCSANWMWAAKLPGEGALMYDAALAMRDIMSALEIAVDGGKDSLSMAARVPESQETVKAPGALVISAYAPCPDITKSVTCDLKKPGSSRLLFIDISDGRCRIGGSSLLHAYGQTGQDPADVDKPLLLKNAFNALTSLIQKGLVLSGHDRSDGGLAVTALEMAFSGNCGIELDIKSSVPPLDTLFCEEPGLLVEYGPENEQEIFKVLSSHKVAYSAAGISLSEPEIRISVNGILQINQDMPTLRELWEETSYRIDRLSADPAVVDEERANIRERKNPSYRASFDFEPNVEAVGKPRVAIIREEGSNGDREMASAFYQAGFEPWDVTMTDLMEGRLSLKSFRGAAFVGGFSYADVLDSAKGWAGVIRFNETVRMELEAFYGRPDSFSLGVCNGCQLMALIGWVPGGGLPGSKQPRFVRNISGRFESRFSTVRILPGPAIMLKGMENSVLGVWVAHGEGRFHCPDQGLLGKILKQELAPIRFADDSGGVTGSYPFNPNGSPEGITSLCSPDGRHLAMMPHPERAFLKWQWPWMPKEMKNTPEAQSPWLKMFQNARKWCEGKL